MTRGLSKVSKRKGMWLAVLAALAISLSIILALAVAAKPAEGATTSRSIEAEKMRGAGKVFRDRRASNNRAKVFYRNRGASTRVRGSIRYIAVRARGDRCGKAPRMKVMVDGRRVMLRWVKNQKRWRYHKKRVRTSYGVHKVKVKFINDRRTRRCDRNLRVDKLYLRLVKNPPSSDSGDDSGSGSGGTSIKPTCDTSLQTLINNAASGATVKAPGGCIYRETTTIDKPLTLTADSGAEIRGSEVWKGWNKSGNYWVRGKLPSFPAHGQCKSGTSRCKWPAQVFLDGKPLRQVASSPAKGQFAVDSNRRVIIANDPAGHNVEVTTRTRWIVGKADNVTIQGFRMKHAANDSQTGAIINNERWHWTIQNNDLSYTHGAVISLSVGKDLNILNNNIHHGGQLGIHSGGAGTATMVVRGNKIHHNNTEDFATGWEAGGLKAVQMQSLLVDRNQVYSNNSLGLWCDINCRNTTFSNNRIYHNKYYAIHFEISSGAKIFGNTVWENGWANKDWGWGAAILILNSRNAEVYNNTLAWNKDGISVIQIDNRPDNWAIGVNDVYVHDNTILAKDYPGTPDNFSLAWLQKDADGKLFSAASNNRGANNKYWYPSNESSLARYNWEGNKNKLSNFNLTPGEESGRYLTKSAKDKIVSAAKIPASASH
ncbi:hypothetical protein BH23ACT11_BH23ACT11_01260 [soil metagenome]